MILIGSDIVPYYYINRIFTDGTSITDEELQEKILDFKVTEKEGEVLTAEFSVVDDTGLVNKLFRFGQKVKIEWGLKKLPTFIETYSSEISGQYKRVATCSVVNSNYTMADGIGYVQVTVRFASGSESLPKNRSWVAGTPTSVIMQIATEMNCNAIIDFKEMAMPFSSKNQIIQNGMTNIAFLKYLASKWNCKLVYQTDALEMSPFIGKIYFVGWDRQDQKYPELRGNYGQYHFFDYGTQESNVVSGSFNSNGNSIGGTSISASQNSLGKFTVSVENPTTEIPEIWELNPAAIQAEMKKRGLKDQMALVNEILSASETEFLSRLRKQYFIKRPGVTNPTGGNGYTGKLTTIYNPIYQIGDLCVVGSTKSPIPPQFKTIMNLESPKKSTLWRITSIVSTINASNTTQEIELAR